MKCIERMRQVAWATFLGVFISGVASAATRPVPGSTPEGNLLRTIAEGHRDDESLLKPLLSCVTGSAHTIGCEQKIALVLARVTENDLDSEERVRVLLRDVAGRVKGGSESGRLAQIDSELRGRSDRSLEARPGSTATKPPALSTSEIKNYSSSYAVSLRVQEVIKAEISGDSKQIARTALEAVLLEKCPGILEGRLSALCANLPEGAVPAALLTIGLSPIWEGIGETDLADLYGGLGGERLNKLAKVISASGNQSLAGYDTLLRRWSLKPPGKWEAWADAAELVGW